MLIASDAERQRRLTHRTLPLAALATVAFVVGLAVGGLRDSDSERTARAFGAAWEKGDYKAMYRLLTPSSRQAVGAGAFKAAYQRAATTATSSGVDVSDPAGEQGDAVRLPVTFRTRVFGPVRGDVLIPVQGDLVSWKRDLVFTGLSPGAKLVRRTRAPARGKILSNDGKVLAQGPASSRSSGALASSITGEVKAPDDAAGRKVNLARGFEADAPTGQSGLERALDDQLAGKPGGVLLAGGKVIARSAPRAGRNVRSTIDTRVQQSAVDALGASLGGIAALDPRTGEVRALAGIAFSGPQPPGSTFKLITTTAALEARKVKLKDDFPVETGALIDGVRLANADDESCGGSFRESFAQSCNSVFAPLGVRVGSKRIVDAAERYGFNKPTGIPGAVPSSIPPAAEIKTPLEVGSTAIGQGKVLATPLELASVAQTIAARGVRSEPTLRAGAPPKRIRVTSRAVAKQITALMLGVVGYGTGTAAQIPGVKVAGKTGTAELGGEETETDAWFTSFAPAGNPKIVVAVLMVRAGAGGEAAAPVAQQVLLTALRK